MKSNKPIAIMILVLILFAGLFEVGQLTGSGVAHRADPSKISSLDHTMPQAPADSSDAPQAPVWTTASPAVKKAAQASIKGQLDAFKQDDYFKATYYQSSSLRSHFRDVASFRSMMIASYPQFASYKSVSFGEARADSNGSSVMIEATVTGKDGVVQHALYTMVKEQNVYRVGGVSGGQLAPPPISRRNEQIL